MRKRILTFTALLVATLGFAGLASADGYSPSNSTATSAVGGSVAGGSDAYGMRNFAATQSGVTVSAYAGVDHEGTNAGMSAAGYSSTITNGRHAGAGSTYSGSGTGVATQNIGGHNHGGGRHYSR